MLDRYAEGTASQAQQADIIRLLLLTGCRRGEIVHLARDEVKGDRIELKDSKTGPRTVLLNAEARAILDRRLRQTDSRWVFPSVREPALWYAVRRETGIGDVRLHDLCRTTSAILLHPERSRSARGCRSSAGYSVAAGSRPPRAMPISRATR